MRIIVTGTPGTGKTQAARGLARRLGIPLVDVNGLIREKRLWHGHEGGSRLVQLPALRRELLRVRGDAVFDSHLLCDLSMPADVVFVLRTDPVALRRRLSKRPYSAKKIRENVEAEALDYCTIRARQNYPPAAIIEVDTTGKRVSATVSEMLRLLHRGEPRIGIVDWSDFFLRSH